MEARIGRADHRVEARSAPLTPSRTSFWRDTAGDLAHSEKPFGEGFLGRVFGGISVSSFLLAGRRDSVARRASAIGPVWPDPPQLRSRAVPGGRMPIFMVERRFAEELEAGADILDGINRINDEEGVRWLYSFLSADKRKTYCLYEAPSPEAIRRAASRAGLPADVIVEVTDRLLPDGASAPI